MKMYRRTLTLELMCTNCRACKTRKRIVAEDGNTQAHYPICESCQDTHEVKLEPGALIILTPKQVERNDFQQLLVFGQRPAVA